MNKVTRNLTRNSTSLVLLRFSGELIAHSRPAISKWTRALVAERRVAADRIVEPVDVSGHRVLGLAAGLPGDRPDQFGLDGLEERLDTALS